MKNVPFFKKVTSTKAAQEGKPRQRKRCATRCSTLHALQGSLITATMAPVRIKMTWCFGSIPRKAQEACVKTLKRTLTSQRRFPSLPRQVLAAIIHATHVTEGLRLQNKRWMEVVFGNCVCLHRYFHRLCSCRRRGEKLALEAWYQGRTRRLPDDFCLLFVLRGMSTDACWSHKFPRKGLRRRPKGGVSRGSHHHGVWLRPGCFRKVG